MIFRYKHKDIVDIDFHLPDKFNFKNYIVVDIFLFGFSRLYLMPKVDIKALIILHIPVK